MTVSELHDKATLFFEAWDKIIEEICKLHNNNEEYWHGVYDCLKIITKHLSGIKENT